MTRVVITQLPLLVLLSWAGDVLLVLVVGGLVVLDVNVEWEVRTVGSSSLSFMSPSTLYSGGGRHIQEQFVLAAPIVSWESFKVEGIVEVEVVVAVEGDE
jgi:hypothetical protein